MFAAGGLSNIVSVYRGSKESICAHKQSDTKTRISKYGNADCVDATAKPANSNLLSSESSNCSRGILVSLNGRSEQNINKITAWSMTTILKVTETNIRVSRD